MTYVGTNLHSLAQPCSTFLLAWAIFTEEKLLRATSTREKLLRATFTVEKLLQATRIFTMIKLRIIASLLYKIGA